MQIRAFPWRRRTRAYAANLLLDTKAALLQELGGGRGGRGRNIAGEILVDPLDQRQVARFLDGTVPDPADDGPRLAEVLVWAARNGVAEADDLALLAELAHRSPTPCRRSLHDLDVHPAAPGLHRLTQRELARRLKINERTLRRRRDRALAALNAASSRYLQAVA